MNELYRMILVDDEDEVRGRISSKISEESGFTVVATAGNGYDALDLIEKYAPQVVLTDIKMPYIDGIELASIIRRDYPTIRVGFITGFNDFDYAREAIKHNVRSYLTKPLTQEDVAEFLRNLKLELDDEYRERFSRELIRRRYEESVPLIIENYFVSFLTAGEQGSLEDLENLKEYQVDLDDARYVLIYARLERNSVGGGIIEYEKLKLSVRANLIEILKREEFASYSFLFNEGIVFIIKEKGPLFARNLDTLLFQMIKTCEHFLKVMITISVSDLYSGFAGLGRAYAEAARAMAFGRLNSEGRIFYPERSQQVAEFPVTMDESDIKTIEHCIRFSSDEEVELMLEKIKQKAQNEGTTGSSFHLYILNLVNIFANYATSIHADIHLLIGEDLLEFMQRFRTLDDLFNWAGSIVKELRRVGEQSKMNNAQRLLASAIAQIEQEYKATDLTMESVCERQGISVSYLSHLFRKYRETTFIKYLTMVRIEKAKELLALTGDRIIEIAAACGYRDVYYFSHSFKRYTGISPRKYREERT